LSGVALNFAGGCASSGSCARNSTGCARGQQVVVHFDQLTMLTMYVASAADRVSLDPLGQVVLPGVAFHRTYLHGMLEKLGIGFEEHRLFRYKSAAETLTRTDMSEADKEQLGRLVDVLYEELRDGIAAGRGLAAAAVDSLVDATVLLLPDRAEAAGLVDAVERWEDVRQWAADGGSRSWNANRGAAFADERWGRLPVVALVYAEGECHVTKGSARDTAEYLGGLDDRKDVAAVVLRADSPGGDPLAADGGGRTGAAARQGQAGHRDAGRRRRVGWTGSVSTRIRCSRRRSRSPAPSG
jgi:protease-4